ncbi:hypothetical protein LOTGIDRAFT_206612 [Lottia gigantea]|uniref:Uncharacterized protein n=1 Tax=Lottia gigantea TaxID=225164 RepID=V4AG61_LOTGI|nr:hypothetical protein LOTGIDRAFT_206612 [Lottia gigantea]ESO92391.1 hypothetical protein LOTGIDRAFT_206612 [Lottia gigantea]
MPPKNDGGKKKLSKAEKEKMKKEEAERKAQEEEEAQRKAVEEEKKHKEMEMLQAEERKKIEKEEKKHRKVQMNELFEILDANKNALQEMSTKKLKDMKWARYMKCDGSPDPTVPGEINTYINLRLENMDKVSSSEALQLVELDNKLIEELDFWLAHPQDLTESNVANYKEAITDLQKLMSTKLNDVTLDILCKATELQDNETYNLQYTVKSENIYLCVWGNLSKKRIKPFEFVEKGFTFDIPKVLALTDCAIRVMFTKYDHLSFKSKALYPKQKKKVIEEPEEAPEPKDEEEETKKEEGEPSEEAEDDFEDPSTPEPAEWEDFDEDDDIIDLRAYHIVGGVISFDLIELPPQPKQVNTWTITAQISPHEVRHIPYIADNANLSLIQKEVKEGQEEKKREERPPISIIYKLPEDSMFVDEPLPGRWDEDIQHWRQDGFTDVKFDEEKRIVQFKTSYFGKLALFQDAHINMPFQSWEIRPRGINNAIFTIIAAVIDIQIEIKDNLCCVIQPTDKIELQPLIEKWMKPEELIKTLKRTGIDIFPAEDSSKFVNVQNKDTLLEERIYQQIALTSSSMAYSWSKWNSEADKRAIIYLGSESLNDESLLEEDWSVFKSTKTRAMKLKVSEISENFSDELAEDIEFQSNLYHLTKIFLSDEGKARLEKTDFQYVDCVEKLLIATKVLTYA